MATRNLSDSVPATVWVWTTAIPGRYNEGHVLATALHNFNRRSGNVRCQVSLDRIPEGWTSGAFSRITSAGGGGYDKAGSSLLPAWLGLFPNHPPFYEGKPITDGAIGIEVVARAICPCLEALHGLPAGSVQCHRVV